MPLPPDYLTYPHRRAGMDNLHYGWTPLPGRERKALADGTKCVVTIIVPVEFFPLNPPKAPFLHPGSMKTAYPDLRHFTVRDYGNRVGIYRLLKAFGDAGIEATFAVNAEISRRYPPLLDAIVGAGHEIAAHGVSTACIHYDGLDEAIERDWIGDARACFPEAVSWMSPARNQSYRTLDLLAEAGFDICLDWEADQRPLAFVTKNGPITTLPHYNELGDFKLLMDRSQTEEEWCAQLLEAARYSVDRYDSEGAGAYAFTLTPHIAGQPYRMAAVRALLQGLKAIDDVAIRTARRTAELFAGADTGSG